ncbi:MAG: NAD-dependent epimerase/dehydratase family protein [Bacteroidales bacterium]
MQTILGSGGSIGYELAKELINYTDEIRLVSRNPTKVNKSDIVFSADFTDANQINQAVKGSEICYITVGFEYNTKIWQQQWPFFIKNVVEACIQYNSKLVFFDNVYAIGKENMHRITESSPISPCSKKGEIRARIDQYIIEQVEKGKIEAIIARAPDFFGAVKKQNSLILNLVYDNLAKAKTAQWFSNADVIHTMGYTPDLAKGTAILGNSSESYNQIWNLPVDMNALTGREWVKLFAEEMNTKDDVKVLPVWLIKLLGIFVPILKEMPEMMYQFDRPYYFDSSKFNQKFNFTSKDNKTAVKQTIEKLKRVN